MPKVNKTVLFTVLFLLLSIAGKASADDVTGLWNSGKANYLSGSYQASLRSGLGAIDLVYRLQCQKMLALIPEADDYLNIETNFNYTFSDQNGIMDYYLQAQKYMTNTNGSSIRVTVDTSLNNIERYVNLARSYEYLSDKGNYKRLVFKIKKSDWTNITENGDAYVIPYLNETNDSIVSGVLFKISFGYPAGMRQSEKDKMMESRVKEIAGKLNIRELSNLVK